MTDDAAGPRTASSSTPAAPAAPSRCCAWPGRCGTCPPGSVATVLASDPAVEHDVPAWAGMRGHAVEEVVPDGRRLVGQGADGRLKQVGSGTSTSSARRAR